MNYASATTPAAKGGFFARVREFLVDAWRVHLEVCEIVAESHRRPY
ncbi:hypothetical protein ACFQ3P_31330 [Paraburkholderia sabiae]|jgi:hypothetical protein|uniref:Uncharacterized protein n=1 Tax=Paraburkholderia sabiae TaxID=273251 RepID=A0ABU9QI88_9BURK|nr:hypothetical protein [Paraburkholderia sabiae]WJZ77504.1 hypothetical protein QEN71_36190 [Paraburkholderia sabiae]CAD6558069.1 hypothetical protein LMG24235_06297 [Paraburkholderia sabiae]CAG9233031.1 conserved hypothetical protein [Paraburkholderia sabiae]